MLSGTAGWLLTVGALVVFGWIGIRAGSRLRRSDDDNYLTARGTQGTVALGLNFFASVLGAWILFAPPEVGTFGGILGIVGYAVGQAVAIAIFAYVGPRIRARMPTGTTVLEFVRARFGNVTHTYVGGISVLYMFVFLAAELTAVGGAVSLLSGADRLIPIIAVAAVTAIYTAYGGLPASLATDRWQGVLILALVAAAAVGIAVDVSGPGERATAAGLGSATQTGLELFIVLVIAITAANLFHQGFWQRVWAARDDRSLVRGAWLGGGLVIPVLFVAGLLGMVAAGGGEIDVPSLALFTLFEELPAALVALVIILAVTLVASSVDTLQNALAALITVDVSRGRLRLGGARLATLALTVPAAVLATENISVLRLFLVADLLAATIALPVFLGLWRRITTLGTLVGCATGLIAVVAAGWILDGSIVDGFKLVTLPDGAALAPFVAAIAGSLLATLAVSWVAGPRRTRGAPAA
ncbi:MAG: sodium:solute symporter [Actinomycetia bacterium]|nr:sodium:solute symporter [Actinomycetes bacterium]